MRTLFVRWCPEVVGEHGPRGRKRWAVGSHPEGDHDIHAKAALSNFCKALSKEVGPRGVRVNSIGPSPVETALWQGAGGVAVAVGQSQGVDPREVARGAAAQSVTGRFTLPSEVAELVLYLAGPHAANITGADFVIDGPLPMAS
ncbi:SDR family oxidoreductase [Streptomyces turgidiscabies]|uniref:NAD(P)-dependent dehydrogenase (Short-subunit alcohol dehydrogenase family) n=1 Tax=Streptomyces turgidiscabies TaxID=85558 RepID=A0ABU0RF45_9ACTN|nr:SDR family oxidoreductase [Streptomyces turgidiscabies]MDQ0930578.1 NAD(P)-dependent dehydrogenase (short-subunit alcohol dehydrogenase family) [Streptomyces turgidiscabies]